MQPIGDFIFSNSSAYLHSKPSGYPSHIKWPGVYDVVDSIAQMARLNWPYVPPPLPPMAFLSNMSQVLCLADTLP